MTDETQHRRSYGFWLAAGLLVAPMLYVLSIGPAAYFVERTGAGEEAASIIYAAQEAADLVHPAVGALGKVSRMPTLPRNRKVLSGENRPAGTPRARDSSSHLLMQEAVANHGIVRISCPPWTRQKQTMHTL
jgi:hypothetical protein